MPPPTINNSAIASMKQQLKGMANLVAQTQSNGSNRTARFRRTIEIQPRRGIEIDSVDLTDAAKIEDPPEVDLVKNMEKVIKELNNYMHTLNTTVRFKLHEGSGRYYASVVDYKKGEEVGQFPIDTMMKAHAQIQAIRVADGLLMDRVPWLLINRQA